jgi:excisionase family DNA binding protein
VVVAVTRSATTPPGLGGGARRLPADGSFEPLVDKHGLAAYLSVSVSWVDKRVARDDFPSYRVGGARRFRLSEVDQWLSGRR